MEATKCQDGQDWTLGLNLPHPIGKLITKLKRNWGHSSQELRVDLALKHLLVSRELSENPFTD